MLDFLPPEQVRLKVPPSEELSMMVSAYSVIASDTTKSVRTSNRLSSRNIELHNEILQASADHPSVPSLTNQELLATGSGPPAAVEPNIELKAIKKGGRIARPDSSPSLSSRPKIERKDSGAISDGGSVSSAHTNKSRSSIVTARSNASKGSQASRVTATSQKSSLSTSKRVAGSGGSPSLTASTRLNSGKTSLSLSRPLSAGRSETMAASASGYSSGSAGGRVRALTPVGVSRNIANLTPSSFTSPIKPRHSSADPSSVRSSFQSLSTSKSQSLSLAAMETEPVVEASVVKKASSSVAQKTRHSIGASRSSDGLLDRKGRRLSELPVPSSAARASQPATVISAASANKQPPIGRSGGGGGGVGGKLERQEFTPSRDTVVEVGSGRKSLGSKSLESKIPASSLSKERKVAALSTMATRILAEDGLRIRSNDSTLSTGRRKSAAAQRDREDEVSVDDSVSLFQSPVAHSLPRPPSSSPPSSAPKKTPSTSPSTAVALLAKSQSSSPSAMEPAQEFAGVDSVKAAVVPPQELKKKSSTGKYAIGSSNPMRSKASPGLTSTTPTRKEKEATSRGNEKAETRDVGNSKSAVILSRASIYSPAPSSNLLQVKRTKSPPATRPLHHRDHSADSLSIGLEYNHVGEEGAGPSGTVRSVLKRSSSPATIHQHNSASLSSSHSASTPGSPSQSNASLSTPPNKTPSTGVTFSSPPPRSRPESVMLVSPLAKKLPPNSPLYMAPLTQASQAVILKIFKNMDDALSNENDVNKNPGLGIAEFSGGFGREGSLFGSENESQECNYVKSYHDRVESNAAGRVNFSLL